MDFIIIFGGIGIIIYVILKNLNKKQKVLSEYENFVAKYGEQKIEKNELKEETKEKVDEILKSNVKIKKLFTRSEIIFYNHLKKEITDYNIFVKVRLIDFIDIEENDHKERFSMYQKTNKKHVDYLIVDNYGNIRLAIELDGKSHNNEKVQENDNFKNGLFIQLWINLLRYKVGEVWDFEKIKILLDSPKNIDTSSPIE